MHLRRFPFRSLALSLCAVLAAVSSFKLQASRGTFGRAARIRFALAAVFFFALAACTLQLAPVLQGQEANARLSGIITDASKALIAGANVVAVNKDTNVRFPTKSNGSGVYVLPSLPIGEYRIEVEHTGFKSIVEASITLHTQDALELNFEMALGSASETVTVNSGTTNSSPAVSMTVSREFVENMPLNGRSLQDLIQLAPSTVSDGDGGYSFNGLRTDSNIYTVDGVSANVGGILNGTSSAAFLGGAAPMQTNFWNNTESSIG